ncbi:MAG: hypothetical protein HOW73_01380 [Polyangiaceae bacterium]|nr:hypothetical protein [Polyangiaceae bacterium]
MFETPIIEAFSRTHPAAPFIFWTPFIAWFLWQAHAAQLAWLGIAGAVVGGLLLWTLTEYLLHRFLFHRIGASLAARRFYFVLHGVHHDFPTDRTRLVMPLGVSIPMGVAIYLLLRVTVGVVAGAAWVDPVFVGFGVGYLAYDGIHYATHHFRMTSPIGRWLKRYHMVHHHTGENARWGVSSPLWDLIFGTLGKKAS